MMCPEGHELIEVDGGYRCTICDINYMEQTLFNEVDMMTRAEKHKATLQALLDVQKAASLLLSYMEDDLPAPWAYEEYMQASEALRLSVKRAEEIRGGNTDE
jgi:hypothetical protein